MNTIEIMTFINNNLEEDMPVETFNQGMDLINEANKEKIKAILKLIKAAIIDFKAPVVHSTIAEIAKENYIKL